MFTQAFGRYATSSRLEKDPSLSMDYVLIPLDIIKSKEFRARGR
jgi:hypothetical protein